MKKYINSRIKFGFQIILIISIFFLISGIRSSSVSLFSSINDNHDKVVDSSIILDIQSELYQESIFSPKYTFTGELTGYSGDCPLCSGYLACPPRTNVIKEGIYYKDKTYGKVRIVASSKNYPCGTILQFDVKKLSTEPIIAIVLDRGVGGNVIDLLTESGEYATKNVGRVKNLDFDVLRVGWK